jgi:hypothetical protein
METVKKLQIVFLAIAALVFIIALLTKVDVLPSHFIMLTLGGLHRVTNTLLLFSISLGVLFLVLKKQ